jgi:RNA polymerase-binding transcription factor DksA
VEDDTLSGRPVDLGPPAHLIGGEPADRTSGTTGEPADRTTGETAIGSVPTAPPADQREPGSDPGALSEDLEIDLLDAVEEELADVERALDRLGEGTYGHCENCGLLLTDEELGANPTGRFCRAHLPLDLA